MLNIKNVLTVSGRDLKAYFRSPIAFMIMGIFLIVVGILYIMVIRGFMQNQYYNQGGQAPNLTEGVIAPFFQYIVFIFLFILPFITMRVIAEERKNQTLVLVFTAPVTLSEFIFGKFLAVFTFISALIGLTLVLPIFLFFVSSPEIGPFLTGLLGSLLFGGAILSIGVFFSSLTDNQIIAGALTFASVLVLWIIQALAYEAGPVLSPIFASISVIGHFISFTQGVIKVEDVVYYLSVIFFFLFLAHRSLTSYRWRS